MLGGFLLVSPKRVTPVPPSSSYNCTPTFRFTPPLYYHSGESRWEGPCSPGPHLSASMATLAFCSAAACWLTVDGQPGGGWACVPGGPWVHNPCWLATGGVMPQLTGGGGGEVAMDAILGLLLLLLKLSDALRRENMVSASGKLGGVAGVFAGVHIWKVKHTQN